MICRLKTLFFTCENRGFVVERMLKLAWRCEAANPILDHHQYCWTIPPKTGISYISYLVFFDILRNGWLQGAKFFVLFLALHLLVAQVFRDFPHLSCRLVSNLRCRRKECHGVPWQRILLVTLMAQMACLLLDTMFGIWCACLSDLFADWFVPSIFHCHL